MNFPFVTHAIGSAYQPQDPAQLHKPRAWQTDFSVSSAQTDGYGDSRIGNGRGGGASSGHMEHINPEAKAILFSLLCTDTGDFETVVINSICRMKP